MQPGELHALFEHRGRLRRDDFGADGTVDDLANFAQHVGVGTAGLGDQTGVRHDTVGKAQSRGFLHLVYVSRIDEEFHRVATSRFRGCGGRSISARANETRCGAFRPASRSEIETLSLGWMSAGANSDIGASTKRRSWSLGCGTCKERVSITSRLKKGRSRSMIRGRYLVREAGLRAAVRRRPIWRSIASNRRIRASAMNSVSISITPFKKKPPLTSPTGSLS